jgi:RHS repeat-associated protein
MTGTPSASFMYDAFGRRIRKTVGGASTDFLYDRLNTVQELTGGSPSANLITGRVDEVFQRTDSSGARSFLADALGSTLALADSTGTLQTSYTYEPFGNPSSTGQANSNSFQFTGRETDGTGLLYYRARYYSPTFQRFASQDPLRSAGHADPNRYCYVRNNPITRLDPLGLDSWDGTSGTGPTGVGGGGGNAGGGDGGGGGGGMPGVPNPGPGPGTSGRYDGGVYNAPELPEPCDLLILLTGLGLEAWGAWDIASGLAILFLAEPPLTPLVVGGSFLITSRGVLAWQLGAATIGESHCL